jgi:hypothetical protein
MRRRASLLINMAAEVAAQAAAQAGVSQAGLPLIVGSAFGELATTMSILRDLEGDGIASPTDFQASVHNSAAGYLSIAHGNQAPCTSIAAGNDTVAMVLLEAVALLAAQGGRVLAVVGDEALPAALGQGAGAAPLAAALLLADAALPFAQRPLVLLDDLRPAGEGAPRPVEVDSPSAAILPLLAAIAAAAAGGSAAGVSLLPDGAAASAAAGWAITVRPWEAP